jgi:hypothetical protein
MSLKPESTAAKGGAMATDPVCGMPVDEAPATGKSVHGGKRIISAWYEHLKDRAT